MTALEFIKSHWLEILVALSVLPVVLRAILQPARGTSLDRWLSRYEALVVDVRKALKSFGIALPGAPVDPLPAPSAAPSLAEVPPAVSSTAPTPIPGGDLPPVLQFPVKPPPPPDPPGAA